MLSEHILEIVCFSIKLFLNLIAKKCIKENMASKAI